MPRISLNRIRQHKGDVFVVLLAAGAVVWIAVVLLNPLRRSEGSIEARLKKQTPLGTPIEQVQEVLKEKGWYDSQYVSGEDAGRQLSSHQPVEPSSLHGYLGEYGTFGIDTYVDAYWHFDQDGKLAAVCVYKCIDGP